MHNKEEIQCILEDMARTMAETVITYTNKLAAEREEKERIHMNTLKQYAYECAQENKYGAYRYIKF